MRYKQLSKTVCCEICGQECRARGLQSHMRLKHQVLTKVIEKIVTISDHFKPHLGEPDSSDVHFNESDLGSVSTQILVTDTSDIPLSHSSTSETATLAELSDIAREFNIPGYKDYYLKHQGEAKKRWAKLIETRFKAGSISSTTDWKAQALDSLAYADSPLYFEFKVIEQEILRKCMIGVEKYVTQNGWDAMVPNSDR